jgi:toxin ParE1/3/4
MRSGLLSPEALADLRDIRAFIARDSRDVADRFIRRLHDKCRLLEESPHLGFSAEELLPELLVWPVGKYNIYYRKTSRGVRIIRILHSARDIPRLFE